MDEVTAATSYLIGVLFGLVFLAGGGTVGTGAGAILAAGRGALGIDAVRGCDGLGVGGTDAVVYAVEADTAGCAEGIGFAG